MATSKVKKYRTAAAQVAAMSEVGYSGLRQSAGTLREEFHKELQGTAAVNVYKEMWFNDPIINAIMFAVTMLMRSVHWYAKPWMPPEQTQKDTAKKVEATPEAKQRAWFLESCLNDMSHTWEDFIAELLTMLVFGYAPHEICYKRRQGAQKKESDSSKYTDGMIGWRKLPLRSQDSIQKWDLDERGGIQGVWQRTTTGLTAHIPITKLLLFRTAAWKNTPEGRSVLRGCYRPWYFKKRIEEVEGIGVERDLSGLPVLIAPESLDIWDENDPKGKVIRAMAEKIVRNIRRDEQEGLFLPGGWEFTLASTQGRRSVDTNAIINRYNNLIAMTVLADFIILGHNNRYGSFALSSNKTHMFGMAIGGWLDSIKGVLNRYAVPRLFAVNGLPLEELPELMYEDVETPDLTELGAYIGRLYSAGFQLFPNPPLESHLLRAASIPVEGIELGREAPKPALGMTDPLAARGGRGGRLARPGRSGEKEPPRRPVGKEDEGWDDEDEDEG